MNLKITKTVLRGCICLLATVLLTVPVSAEAAREFHWYCMKNKDHAQAIASEELRFAEDYGGIYLDHLHGDKQGEKVMYLTFDAGYENGNVEKILDVLKKTDTKGAFFLVKHFVTSEPQLVLRMKEEGHLLCNHTVHHPNLAKATPLKIKEEIEGLEEAVLAVTGEKPAPFFRPPEGSFSKEMLKTVESLGYRTVFWSFAYADWDNKHQMPQERALQALLTHTHNGEILLLHPTSDTNAAILERFILQMKEEGYRFGTLDEIK